MTVATSATLAIDERVRARLAAGERIVHLGFGEAGLPVPEFVREQLARTAGAPGTCRGAVSTPTPIRWPTS